MKPVSSSLPLGISPPKQNLRRLVVIRWLLLLVLAGGVAGAFVLLELALPYATIAAIMAGIVAFNLLTWYRLGRAWPVTQLEFGLQIVGDIVGVSVLFYFCGGATNPFVSYYLVPLSISAATLPWVYTWSFAALSLGAYTLLLFFYVPIAGLAPIVGDHAPAEAGVHPHIIGMWFNFLLSAALITYFVVRMSNTLREQERELNTHREDELRAEQVLAVATLAAGTAHELGSPLTTMKLLLSEIADDNPDNPELRHDVGILQRQVDACSNTLKQLVERAETGTQQGLQIKSVRHFCESLFERWLVLRPEVEAEITYSSTADDFRIQFHSTLEQAIINLLNNAADAEPKRLAVTVQWNANQLMLTVLDRGPGVSPEVQQRLGQPFVTTKGRGLGLGLFLSNATISRYGGSVELFNRDEGGTRTETRLPLARAD